jgi:hypothetical protein
MPNTTVKKEAESPKVKTGTPESVERTPESAKDSPANPEEKQSPVQNSENPATPEKPTLLDEHIKRPEGDLVLTVKVKRFFFFGVTGQEIQVLQGEKTVDRIVTDSRGQALFKLPPGEYTVKSGDKQVPIDLKSHASLRL